MPGRARDRGAGDRLPRDGSPTREFQYVEDCAEAIVLATERYEGPEPVNIGTGFEISIRELVEVVVELDGFRGGSSGTPRSPNGQPRRCLGVSWAQRGFKFCAHTTFRDGLARTVAWCEATRGLVPAAPAAEEA